MLRNVLMNLPMNRRLFLRRTALGAGGLCIANISWAGSRRISPNEKLNLAVIGVAHQGASDMSQLESENIVALCDVDRWRLALEGNPAVTASARKNKWDVALLKDTFRSTDFRELLVHRRVDAVMISTPDHWHVPIALASMPLLPVIMLFALWRRSFREVGLLAATVTLAILVQIGALTASQAAGLAEFGPELPVRNHRGTVVGQSRPVFKLQ